MAELRVWFETQIAKQPASGSMAVASHYALKHWPWFEAQSPYPKNGLFAESDEGVEDSARMTLLIGNCKLDAVNSITYNSESMTRFVNGWPQCRIDELMSGIWQPNS